MSAVAIPTRFILIQTSHAGNVGAVARAMKTMGFHDLVLVAPRWPNVLRRQETIQRASGALDVLEQARIVDTLDQALDGMSHLCATAMIGRDFGPPTRSPRTHFDALLNKELSALSGKGFKADLATNSEAEADPLCAAAPAPGLPKGVAFLFGSERFGMANEDVYRCHVALSIPTNPQFGSLNLGAAVQVIAYEWRQALAARGWGVGPQDAWLALPEPGALTQQVHQAQQADAAQLAGMLGHWQQALEAVGFLDPAAPKKLMPRLNQLFNRAQLTQEEIHLLRGIAKAMLGAASEKAQKR